jgi:hypothetical protein
MVVVDKKGVEHKFYAPTHLTKKKLIPYWDVESVISNEGGFEITGGIELIEDITDDERKSIVELLNINLAPEFKD